MTAAASAASIAACLIREGLVENAAFAEASKRSGQSFAAVRDAYKRTQRVFVHSERDVQASRREWDNWQTGETMTGAEKGYYRRPL